MTLPGHLSALIALRRARVDFLVIGALGLAHYAPDAASFYVTGDCDILVKPTEAQLYLCLRTLRRLAYRLAINDEPLADVDPFTITRLIERRIAIRAEKDDSLPIDVLTDATGYSFEEWWETRTSFRAGRSRIPCAGLEQILLSKKAAGRGKDKKILALYQTLLKKRAKRR